jgi:hypothetical protein
LCAVPVLPLGSVLALGDGFAPIVEVLARQEAAPPAFPGPGPVA